MTDKRSLPASLEKHQSGLTMLAVIFLALAFIHFLELVQLVTGTYEEEYQLGRILTRGISTLMIIAMALSAVATLRTKYSAELASPPISMIHKALAALVVGYSLYLGAWIVGANPNGLQWIAETFMGVSSLILVFTFMLANIAHSHPITIPQAVLSIQDKIYLFVKGNLALVVPIFLISQTTDYVSIIDGINILGAGVLLYATASYFMARCKQATD